MQFQSYTTLYQHPWQPTRDGFIERLQSVRETVSLLYNTTMQNMEYGRERLKDIVEKEARKEEKEEEYNTVPE